MFRELTIDDRELIDSFTKDSPISFFRFGNLYMWRGAMQTRIAHEDGVLYLTQSYLGRHPCAMMPFCEKGREKEALARLRAMRPDLCTLRPMRKDTADLVCSLIPGSEASSRRGGWDYLYLTEDLVHLEGRKYHAKKNHLNAFLNSYSFVYHDIKEGNKEETELLLRAAEKMHRLMHEKESEWEYRANVDAITHLNQLGFRGAALTVGEEIVAYSIGEQIRNDMALIHVEKADTSFRGAYAAINQMFASHAWSHLTYINREEDMGIEGLRKAKMSYHPAGFNEMYAVSLPQI